MELDSGSESCGRFSAAQSMGGLYEKHGAEDIKRVATAIPEHAEGLRDRCFLLDYDMH